MCGLGLGLVVENTSFQPISDITQFFCRPKKERNMKVLKIKISCMESSYYCYTFWMPTWWTGTTRNKPRTQLGEIVEKTQLLPSWACRERWFHVRAPTSSNVGRPCIGESTEQFWGAYDVFLVNIFQVAQKCDCVIVPSSAADGDWWVWNDRSSHGIEVASHLEAVRHRWAKFQHRWVKFQSGISRTGRVVLWKGWPIEGMGEMTSF